VAVGDIPPFYDDCIDTVDRYAKCHGFDHIVQTEPMLKIRPVNSARSREAVERLGYLPVYEKENAFSLLSLYDYIVVLDADVAIRSDAPDIIAELGDNDFGGVVERDMPITPEYKRKIAGYSHHQYHPLNDVDWLWNDAGAEFFNMGVMVLRNTILEYLDGETPAQFIRRPEFEPLVNGEGHWKWSTDQTMLNWWVKRSGMKYRRLSWRWNALYGAVRDVTDAHFIHFFLSSKMPRGGAEIPEIVRSL